MNRPDVNRVLYQTFNNGLVTFVCTLGQVLGNVLCQNYAKLLD